MRYRQRPDSKEFDRWPNSYGMENNHEKVFRLEVDRSGRSHFSTIDQQRSFGRF